jgi:phosphate starvation-inducible PhoH-like protein
MTTHRKQRKIKHEEEQRPQSLTAKTENQKNYIIDIVNEDVIFCVGPSGSGKSYIASGIAADRLYRNEIDQVIVTRPLVCAGKDIGSLPGDVSEKIMPHLSPMEENLRYFLGKVNYGKLVVEKRIRYEPLELMRGATFHNSIMILDEAQNCTKEQIKMFITRMGENSKVIINGDTKQTDLYGDSGLMFCINRLEKVEGVGVSVLDYSDIQGNGILGRILTALEEGD